MSKTNSSGTEVVSKPRPHWYRRYIGECPLCGRDAGYKERVYGKKPADPSKVWVHLSNHATYDGCEP